MAFLSFGLSACCNDCDPPTTVCMETPPVNELCQAAFQRWFYDQETNNCKQIGYSGCSQVGFATQSECEACICNK